MKKISFLLATCLVMLGCSNESTEFNGASVSASLISNQQQDVSNQQQGSNIPLQSTRNLSFTLNSGIVDITCTYDESNEEHCTGVYRETGAVVSDDVVRELVESPKIDKRIEESLANGCENKKIILNCELRDEYPNIARPEGTWDNPEVKAYDQKKIESRKKAVDEFVTDNPGITSEASAIYYKESTYGTLELTMNACDYQDFIQKNKNRIYILELSGIVNVPAPVDLECDNPVDYAILYEGGFSEGKENAKPQHFIFTDEASFHKYLDGMKADMYEYDGFDFDKWIEPYKAISNNFDFSKNQLVVFEGGQSGTCSVRMMVTEACNNKMKVDVTMCVGKPVDAAMSWPAMFVRMPKGQYEFSQGNRGLVCGDDYEPIPGQVPDQIIASVTDGGFCEYPAEFIVLEKTNLGGAGDEETYWNKQAATIIENMDSLNSYLDSLRKRLLGEYIDGIDNSIHYLFDGYVEKYADFDFSQNIMIAFEGGYQPSGGYGMRIEPVCSHIVEFNVTHCTNPEIGYTSDIGYPFILASFPKREYYEFKGGSIGIECNLSK